MIRFGIVGTGAKRGIAHYHAEGIGQDGRAEIRAVYDKNPQAAEKWVLEHGLEARVCRSYDELLEQTDALSICVPNAYHHAYALKAAEAGRHFLLEKPMASDIRDARMLKAACEDKEICAMVGFVYRYSNAVNKAKDVIKNQLGTVYTVSAWFGGKRLADPSVPLEWRMLRRMSGSGALGDFGSHLIDLAFYAAGQRYRKVSAMTETFIPEREGRKGPEAVENDDAAVLIAKSEHAVGSFTMSRTGMDDLMLMVTGEGGMLELSLRAPEHICFWEKKREGAYTGVQKQIEFLPQKPFAGWFDAEMRAFIDRIEGRKIEVPGLAEGLYAEEVLDAAGRSALSGREEKVGAE